MTNQSNPTNENRNQTGSEQSTAKTEMEQKKAITNVAKEDGEREEGQNKGKTTTTPTGQATSQNPQAKTGTTAQNQTPEAKSTQRGNA